MLKFLPIQAKLKCYIKSTLKAERMGLSRNPIRIRSILYNIVGRGSYASRRTGARLKAERDTPMCATAGKQPAILPHIGQSNVNPVGQLYRHASIHHCGITAEGNACDIHVIGL